MDENEKVVRDDQMLTARVWHLIDKISADIGVQLLVGQGGFRGEHGALASGSTHNEGDVFDLRVRNLNQEQRLEVVQRLRYWNGCAWYRSPEYGWTSTGPHIHCVMRDSYYGLSSGAKWQVEEYDRGKNGLSGMAPDPFPQPPVQHHYTVEEDLPLTNDELNAIADRVWAKAVTKAWDGKQTSALSLLNSTHYYSVSAGADTDVPATAGTAPGTPTVAKQILAGHEAGDLSDNDVKRIANAVADLLAIRLRS